MRAEIHEMKKEQSTISMMDEFARHARLERKINKMTDKLKTHGRRHAGFTRSHTSRIWWGINHFCISIWENLIYFSVFIFGLYGVEGPEDCFCFCRRFIRWPCRRKWCLHTFSALWVNSWCCLSLSAASCYQRKLLNGKFGWIKLCCSAQALSDLFIL